MASINLWNLLKETWNEFNDDDGPRLAAALSYYTAFSLAPLLIVVIAVVGLLFGQEAAQGEIVRQISGLVGKEGAELINTMILNAATGEGGTLATIIGIATLLFGATGVYGELQTSLNRIWDLPDSFTSGTWHWVKSRILSFALVLGTGFLLLVSLMLSAGVSAFIRWVLPDSVDSAWLLSAAELLLSFLLITTLLGMIYKILPDIDLRWSDVRFGAIITAVLFTLGKFLIGLYLGQSAVSSSYGAAGALAVILLWVYYSAQILFLGAEFTQVYSRARGFWREPQLRDNPRKETTVEAPNHSTKKATKPLYKTSVK